MTGYQSKKSMAQDKLDDDDIQDYKKPWVDLTPQDYAEIFVTARNIDHATRLTAAKLKEKNS